MGQTPDSLVVGGKTFNSRVFIGTGKFSSGSALSDVIKASGTEMVTVAMKRANPKRENDSILKYLRDQKIQLLPNTNDLMAACIIMWSRPRPLRDF